MYRRISAAVFFLGLVILVFGGCVEKPREEIVIAMPRGEFIRNIDTNYYKLWLEDKTELSLTFLYMDENHTPEHLDKVFSSGDVRVDAFFSFASGDDFLRNLSRLQEYGEKGYILPLNGYLDGKTNLERIFNDFEDYDLQSAMTSGDGNIYFMPGLDATRSNSIGNVLWINKSWLSRLGLTIPQTTQDLRDVLEAFAVRDPNKNGLLDEIPFCGSAESYGLQGWNNIMNAFVYNDPENSRLFVKDGKIVYAPVTEEWRDGLRYLDKLYAEGLLSPLQFELSARSLSELANSPKDVVGAFTANHITDVLLQNSPEILSGFIQVPPLTGPKGVRYATLKSPMPGVAGVITASCGHPAEVFRLMDLMLSEEAFLLGRFGEKGVNWIDAGAADMDFYNRKATVRVINGLQNKVQNKHISELGPFFAWPRYADGVTVTGIESDQEYINARAHWTYEPYIPDENLGALLYTGAADKEIQALRAGLDDLTDQCIKAFITGEKNPGDDAVWSDVIKQYERMGYQKFVMAIQQAYDDDRMWN